MFHFQENFRFVFNSSYTYFPDTPLNDAQFTFKDKVTQNANENSGGVNGGIGNTNTNHKRKSSGKIYFIIIIIIIRIVLLAVYFVSNVPYFLCLAESVWSAKRLHKSVQYIFAH